jgi:CRP-like cAMP-binding protein
MEKIDKLIGKCALFEHINANAASSFFKQAQLMQFSKGDKIIEQGSLGQGIYIVAEGGVDVVLEISQHEKAKLTELTVGDILGEMSLLIDTPRTATAVAQENTKVYFIDGSDIKESLSNGDAQAMQMILNLAKIVAKRLYQCNQFLSTLWSERNNAEYLQHALQNSQLLLSKILV